MKGVPSTAVGACFALTAFAVAILAGLFANNQADLILQRAIIAMILCYPIGLLFGAMCRRVVAEHAQAVTDSLAAHTAQTETLGDVEIVPEEEAEEVIHTS